MRPSARETQHRIVTGWKSGFANRPVSLDYRSLPYSRSSLRGFTHISGKNRLGRFMLRRTTIRKRMRAKLRQVKQQLRERMHDPVPRTGQWLRSVVQGYFNYYGVPGNLTRSGCVPGWDACALVAYHSPSEPETPCAFGKAA